MGMVGVGELSRMSGVPTYTLRRLDNSGKLKPCFVEKNGYRWYDRNQVDDAKRYVKVMRIIDDSIQSVIDESVIFDSQFSYFLGLVFADGTVLKSGQIQIELKDEQLISDMSSVFGVKYHKHSGRNMYRLTVPSEISKKMIQLGVCRNKSQGFDVPEMCSESFGHFIRGLFDGDGSVSVRHGRTTFRIHGNPKSLAYIQNTFLKSFGIYLIWYKDNRVDSGMLETSKKDYVLKIRDMMYRDSSICLSRKKNILYLN